ncbi:MAG: hypothetical protein H6730_16185 [Deltaproteobacteria bacterium]|nr:hypothetical protein [Deltaproteobacteria bacterium]
MATRVPAPGTQKLTQVQADPAAPAPAAAPKAGPARERPAPTAGGRHPPASVEGFAPPQGKSQVAARGFDPTAGARLFAFDPRHAPNSVGFIEVLRQVAGSPKAAEAVTSLAKGFEQMVGPLARPEVVQAALLKPELLAGALVVTPEQMKLGFTALHRTPAGQGMKPAEKARQLPRHFDFAKIGDVQVSLPKAEALEELAPGLYRGSVRDPAVGDADAKARIVLAEVMDRLAENATLPKGARFSVTYEGGTHTRLEGFLEALAAHGHVIEARVDHRVADFLDLKVKTPDGVKSVAAPVMVKTGVTGRNGEEAVIPAVHSEVVYTVRPGPELKGQAVTGEVKWYQGVPDTGFFASGLTQRGDWVGTITTARLEGAEALTAAKYSGLLSDVINAAASRAKRPMAGYGDTGVCIDSVAMIVRLMGREITAFPMLQGDELLVDELQRRLGQAGAGPVNRQDAPEYRALLEAVRELPSDAEGRLSPARPEIGLGSPRDRVLGSLPWAPGAEPLAVAAHARAILG